MTHLRADPGSFRDPGSRVYIDDDRVIRALRADAARAVEAAMAAPFFDRARRAGRIVETERLTDPPADLGLGDGWEAALAHPRLPVWTYPFEWSFSMLRDAAVLQLELLRDALADGITCKDASSYNVQFDGVRPVFVDVGSFEPYTEGEPWYGYLQFCQLYLFPLLLQAYADIPFQPRLRSSIDGITPEEAWQALGPTRILKKGVPVHVALHARAQRRFADTTTDVKQTLERGGFRKSLVEANVKGLLGVLASLRWEQAESTWSDYGDRAHYTESDLGAKEAFVTRAAARGRHRLAWDIGCNDGRFSRLVAEHAEHVVAFDGDHLVVDMLYRALTQEGLTNITPLVLDLADPSPAIGWANRERPAFLERSRPDFVLALAVIHHLAISSNVPIASFLDLLRDLHATVVVEFPTEHDPMVARLMRNKKAGVHDDYTLATFEAAATERFEVRHREVLRTRVLFELGPRR